MKVIEVTSQKPSKVLTFDHYLWANMPASWTYGSSYFNSVLFVSITVQDDDGNVHKIARKYSQDDIESNGEATREMAYDCAKEIMQAMETSDG
jgi:hypothetical protein